MPQIFLAIGVLVVSTAPALIRLAQPLPPLTIAAFRVLLAGIVLLLLSGRQLKEIKALSRRSLSLLAASGLALGAHFALWIASLSLTSTSASVALVATQPVFAGLLGVVFLGEGFRRQELWGIGLAGVGCLVLAGGDLGGTSSDALLGDAMSLAGAITVAAYLLIGRALRQSVPLLAYLALVNLVAAGVLFATGAAIGMEWSGYGQWDYLAVLFLALGPSVVGHTLINDCVRRVPVHLVSLGILVEPVAATLSTWLFFQEVPSIASAVGEAIIVIGIYVGFGLQSKKAE